MIHTCMHVHSYASLQIYQELLVAQACVEGHCFAWGTVKAREVFYRSIPSRTAAAS